MRKEALLLRNIICLFFILTATNVCASEEGVLTFSDFVLKSEGIGSSGPVEVIGKRVSGTDGEIAIRIKAFSKEYDVPKDFLKELRYGMFNGVRLSYEHGYEQTGGKVVYIILEFGFISGVRDSVLIAMHEDGSSYVKSLGKKKGD